MVLVSSVGKPHAEEGIAEAQPPPLAVGCAICSLTIFYPIPPEDFVGA